MKTSINTLVIAIIAMIITSCNNSGDKNSSNSGDSIQEEIFTTPDLSLFQLKGHVKKCIIPYEGLGDEIYEFDKDGNLISPKYEKIKRDANGAIIEYYDPERKSTIRITWKNGKVKDVTELFDDGYNYSCYGYEYDENNNIVQMGIAHVALPYNYSDYKFDEFGNWISRIEESNGTSVEEKRYITYYGSDAGQERLLEHYGQKKEEEIQRNIEQSQLEEEALQAAKSHNQQQEQDESKGPEWIQGSWELTINSPYGAIATYHLTINGQNAHLVEGNKDKYNGRYEIKDGQMIVGPRKYDINDQYQRLEYAQYRWHKISGGSNHQAYQGRNSSFSSASDVMRYLSGRTFYNSGDGLRIDYNAVYLNGRALTGAPRVVDISGNSATVVANSPYSGGGTLHFYVNASRGTITQDGDVYRAR